MALNIAEINREIHARCKQFGLEVDCGADGDYNATIAIVAEAPGDRERQLKMPLCGGSGKLLWDTVRRYGITRRNTYVSNVFKRQLLVVGEGSKYEKIHVSAGEQGLYASVLLWELQQLPNLKFVVCLGNAALQALTGLSGITQYRGSVLDVQLDNPALGTSRVVRVLAMNNPAAILRNPKEGVMFKFDCSRLNELATDTFVEYEITSHINPTFDEAMAWIDKMESDKLPVSLDVETSSDEVICFGLANDPHEGMCIPLRTQTDNYWTHEQEVQILLRVARLVQHPDTQLVMQNGMYDSSFLWFIDRIRVTRPWFDTMLAHHTLYPTMPHNLGFLTTQYTTHPYYKDDGKKWKSGGSIDDEWLYNVKDACITLAVAQAELKELEEQGLSEFFFSHVMTLHPHLVEMTVLGVATDPLRRLEIAEKLRADIAVLREQFYADVAAVTHDSDYKPNPASPAQMSKLYFDRLGLVGRGIKTDKENRRRMRAHPRTTPAAIKMLNTVDALAVETKFYSTYVESTVDADNRYRTEYKQTGVQSAPGRLSSAGNGWGTGGNLQNQPERAHEMFIADEGYEFNYFDLAQAEARSVGWRYVIPTWMDQFERARTDGTGYDAHRALASTMYNIPYDEVPKSDYNADGTHSIRYTAKRCRHGLNYRMMADRLATTLNISNAEAEYLWALYHSTNPEVAEGWAKDVEMVKKTGRMYNAFGRRWILMQDMSDEALEAIVAFYHQSTIGDKVCKVIYQSHSDPGWPRGEALIRLNIHDALIAINRIGHGEAVRAVMKKYATEPIPILGHDGVTRDLIIPCDMKTSVAGADGIHRWSTLQKAA